MNVTTLMSFGVDIKQIQSKVKRVKGKVVPVLN
jgi:hypothetical protein